MRNRTVLGIVCILLSLLITFGFSPLINRLTDGEVTVIRLVRDVKQGDEITAEDLETVRVKKSTLPDGTITDVNSLKDKYALSDLYKGDYLNKDKLSGSGNTVKEVFASLDGKKAAVSFTVDSLAAGLSGKLQAGDIISFIITDKNGETKIPPELKYVKVITTTTQDGVDADKATPNENGVKPTAATVTVLCNSEQARLIAAYENSGSIQTALVYRGKEETAKTFLAAQDKYFGEG